MLFVCFGCNRGTRGREADGSANSGVFRKCEYEGHVYIVYKDGFGTASFGGIEHDPDCDKCRKK